MRSSTVKRWSRRNNASLFLNSSKRDRNCVSLFSGFVFVFSMSPFLKQRRSTQTTEGYAHFAPSTGDADTVDAAFAPAEAVDATETTDGEALTDELLRSLRSLRSVTRAQLAEVLTLVVSQNGA